MENINWETIYFNELDTILQINALEKSVLNEVLSNRLTPMCLACKFKREDLLTVLLHYGARTDKCAAGSGKYPLHFACCHRDGNCGMVRKLLRAKAEINAQDEDGNTSLHFACKEGNIPVVELLIEHGASVNVTNIDGETPLLEACIYSNVELVDILLKAGSDPNVKEGHALQLAVYSPSFTVCSLLIAAGADINDKGDILICACQYGTYSVIKVLLENGAKVNKANSQGWSPLHFACRTDYSLNVQLLLEWGADVHARTNNGSTPLHTACDWLMEDNIKLLLQYGADVNVKDYQRHTLLTKLFYNGNSQIKLKETAGIMRLLIAAGCRGPQYGLINMDISLLFADAKNKYPTFDEVFSQVLPDPQNLQSQCRIVIRKSVPPNIDKNLDKLPLPLMIVRFLKFHYI